MKYKEIISSEIPQVPELAYNSLDFLLNKWLEENEKMIKVFKIHYQLAGTNGRFRSSALIEYTERFKNEKSDSRV